MDEEYHEGCNARRARSPTIGEASGLGVDPQKQRAHAVVAGKQHIPQRSTRGLFGSPEGLVQAMAPIKPPEKWNLRALAPCQKLGRAHGMHAALSTMHLQPPEERDFTMITKDTK